MSGTDYPAWFEDDRTRRTLIVEIQFDPEDVSCRDHRDAMWVDIESEMAKFGTVIGMQWTFDGTRQERGRPA